MWNLGARILRAGSFQRTGRIGRFSRSEHSVRVGARNIRRDHWYRVFRVANELQGVPMFDCPAAGIHLVDVDAGDPRILRVVIEEIQKVDVRPYIVADGDDTVDDDAGPGAFPRDLGEELSQRDRTVCDQRVVLDISGADEFFRAFFRLLRVDHQIIEGEDIVLVANGAAIVGVNDFDHGWLLLQGG